MIYPVVRRTLGVDAEAGVVELHHGGEETQPSYVLQHGNADEERLGQISGQDLHQEGQEVGQQIEHRQHEGVACQHGAKRRQTGKQQCAEQHRQHRIDHRHQIEEPPPQGNKAHQRTHDREGDQGQCQRRQRVGGEQARPVHRQGVHQPHRPGVIQVSPHRHNAQNGVRAGEAGHKVARDLVQPLPEERGVAGMEPVLHQGQLQVQGQHGPYQRHAAPHGPEAAQVLAEQRPVKEGSL